MANYNKQDVPPPYGMNMPPPHPPVAIVNLQPPALVSFGPTSQGCMCPHCHSQISTSVRAESTTKTHLMALLLCCFLCWPCACLPYCMDSCQSQNHYCPSCGAFLGAYDK